MEVSSDTGAVDRREPRSPLVRERVQHELAPHPRRAHGQTRVPFAQTTGHRADAVASAIAGVAKLSDANRDGRERAEDLPDGVAAVGANDLLAWVYAEGDLGGADKLRDLRVIRRLHTTFVQHRESRGLDEFESSEPAVRTTALACLARASAPSRVRATASPSRTQRVCFTGR